MNQRQIGTILVIAGLLLSVFVYLAKAKEDATINAFIAEKNTCYLADGTCLHDDREYGIYVLGWGISAALFLFGVYLAFFDKTQMVLAEHQVKVASALKEAKRNESSKEKFEAFLAGFTEDERKAISAIHEQDGILQSTLRYRTGLSKSSLSLMLSSLEERQIISRKTAGKTNQVFLRKKF
jgi:uncharacterized membrane protein